MDDIKDGPGQPNEDVSEPRNNEQHVADARLGPSIISIPKVVRVNSWSRIMIEQHINANKLNVVEICDPII